MVKAVNPQELMGRFDVHVTDPHHGSGSDGDVTIQLEPTKRGVKAVITLKGDEDENEPDIKFRRNLKGEIGGNLKSGAGGKIKIGAPQMNGERLVFLDLHDHDGPRARSTFLTGTVFARCKR